MANCAVTTEGKLHKNVYIFIFYFKKNKDDLWLVERSETFQFIKMILLS